MEDFIKNAVSNAGIFAYIGSFLAGIFTSLTPCVYPMIPVTIGIIGSRAAGNKFKGFILSFSYVLGLSVTYTILGAIAAKSGSIFGETASNPWINLIIANICILFGLSMFDIFTIPTPSFISKVNVQGKNKGILTSFLLGTMFGLVAAPCTAPVVGVILAQVATTGSVAYGSSLLFTFSMGIGVLFVVIGTFTGILTNMPKAGMWMVKLKKGMAVLMIVVGEYFLIQAGMNW